MGVVEQVGEVVEYGEVFTRRWVVDLILDLCAYTSDRDLASLHAVEPACGSGAFLGSMIERLSDSLLKHGKPLGDAAESIRAYDLLGRNIETSRNLVVRTLVEHGWDETDAARLSEKWITQGDYLLRESDDHSTDVVVGNPPYIRLEDVPEDRTAAYRAACPTMGGRADIYIGFIEVALRSLRPGGVLGFIVADHWMRNSYGARLREFVARDYSVDVTVQMHDVDAFDERVSAYPAISVIRCGEQLTSVVADTTRAFGEVHARALVEWTRTCDAAPLAAGRQASPLVPRLRPVADGQPDRARDDRAPQRALSAVGRHCDSDASQYRYRHRRRQGLRHQGPQRR